MVKLPRVAGTVLNPFLTSLFSHEENKQVNQVLSMDAGLAFTSCDGK